jgi:hypothetical protein
MKYYIFSDESCHNKSHRNAEFNHFYSFLIIDDASYKHIQSLYNSFIAKYNLKEIKWTKISNSYLNIYKEFIDIFFNILYSKHYFLRYRIAYLPTYHSLNTLSREIFEDIGEKNLYGIREYTIRKESSSEKNTAIYTINLYLKQLNGMIYVIVI